MRSVLTASALLLALGLADPALAQGANTPKDAAAAEAAGTEVTGIVQEVDREGGRMVVEGEEFVFEPGGGATLIPSPGDEITLFYEERDGRKVITRMGQKQ